MKKYGNKKTLYNGQVYDSKKEAKRAYELNLLQRAGVISNLERQRRFELLPAYTNNKGKKVRPIIYIADFVYKKNGIYYVEDVKGSKKVLTDVYRIKKKIFEYKYPEYIFIEFM